MFYLEYSVFFEFDELLEVCLCLIDKGSIYFSLVDQRILALCIYVASA